MQQADLTLCVPGDAAGRSCLLVSARGRSHRILVRVLDHRACPRRSRVHRVPLEVSLIDVDGVVECACLSRVGGGSRHELRILRTLLYLALVPNDGVDLSRVDLLRPRAVDVRTTDARHHDRLRVHFGHRVERNAVEVCRRHCTFDELAIFRRRRCSRCTDTRRGCGWVGKGEGAAAVEAHHSRCEGRVRHARRARRRCGSDGSMRGRVEVGCDCWSDQVLIPTGGGGAVVARRRHTNSCEVGE